MVLALYDLTIHRGVSSLAHLSALTLAAGDVLWLKGANGAGKSTLLRVLAGLRPPQKGRITWQERSMTAAQDYEGNAFYLPSGNVFDPAEKIENLIKAWRRDPSFVTLPGFCQDKIESLALLGHLPLAMLSAGQQRFLALIPFFLSSAQIAFLDEPTIHLDDAARQFFYEMVKAKAAKGMIVILASHDTPLDGAKICHLTLPAEGEINVA